MINSRSVIAGAGFETPAEAMYLGKTLMVVPAKGHYKQKCKAAALQKWV
ncbi:MAG: glycosyltransferase family protein [Bacteroidota bacterium]|nr:glycosyltransferase family protein [Bacteroidota bacterium]MDP4214253.1 glycosyltransferase family protein [Bacteroidota bacterium]MDP4250316.1 glycosyltransferase family protein [Bacteroidota bacterium]